jgi:hypothetical protein
VLPILTENIQVQLTRVRLQRLNARCQAAKLFAQTLYTVNYNTVFNQYFYITSKLIVSVGKRASQQGVCSTMKE